jgi:hypothetical protein
MEISRFNMQPDSSIRLSPFLHYSLAIFLLGVATERPWAQEPATAVVLEQVLNGQCAVKTYGGFMKNAVLEGGKLRLTRLKGKEDPLHERSPDGHPLIRVLDVSNTEVDDIYRQAYAKELSSSEMTELIRLCGDENSALKSARLKIAMQSMKQAFAEMSKQKPSIPDISLPFPVEKPKLAKDEQFAMDALKNSELAQVAIKKIYSKVIPNIAKAFAALNADRGYDAPYSQDLRIPEEMRMIQKRGSN